MFWRDFSGSSSPDSRLQQDQLEQVVQNHVLLGFGYLHTWRSPDRISGHPEVPWCHSRAKEVRDKSAAHSWAQLRRRGLLPQSSLLTWAAKQSSWRLCPHLCAFEEGRRCPEGQSWKHTREGSSTASAQDICPPLLCSAQTLPAVLPPALGPQHKKDTKLLEWSPVEAMKVL